ncbi:MAG: helix-turn-helix domain-containing protein [Myxococcales bacterium]|nr:helix-turn-helix domain-containing protein [Myxococcales bacterium]
MPAPALTTTLRVRRAAAGLSQAELATRVGVSRQALNAIEAGRQVPSTVLALQLARALGCAVHDLFGLSGGSTLAATWAGPEARGGARVVVGCVDGIFVAHPVGADPHAADGLVGAPARPDGDVQVQLLTDARSLENNVLVAGCAPLLGVLAERLGRRHADARATWLPGDSARALDLLARGRVHLAGVHLAERVDDHARLARAALRERAGTLIHLARWRQGFVVAPGNPLDIRAAADLLRPDVRCALRGPGAGAQALLTRLLRAVGADAPAAPGPVAADHTDIARLVRWGVVDVGVGIEAAALAAGLDFVPLTEERFDLVGARATIDAGPVARLLDLIDRPAFRDEAACFPGYDLSAAGHAASVAAG